MLCYSLIEKRGDYIKKYINWKLISNNEVVINNELVECEFEDSILKYYEDKDTINIVDLKNDVYIRENSEFTFKIDFKNRCFDYILKKEDLSIKNASLEATIEKDKEIHLKYNLGDDIKEIIIHLL